MYARDADNGQVVILGPRRLMESNITIVGSTTVWDPKKRHVQATAEAKIPRPPNAYILYRKDQQAALKAANPGIPNNDICKLLLVVLVNDSSANIMQPS